MSVDAYIREAGDAAPVNDVFASQMALKNPFHFGEYFSHRVMSLIAEMQFQITGACHDLLITRCEE